jgi:hypothetical protein
MNVRRVVSSVVVVAALGLTGCAAADPGKVTPPPPAGKTSSGGAGAVASSPAPGVAQVGGTYTYPDGVAVSVVSASRFAISKTAAGDRTGDGGIKATVKITNGSSKPLAVSTTRINVRSGANGATARLVVDSASGVGVLTGTIPPGGVASAVYGFAVPAAEVGGALSVDVTPEYGRAAALFTGTVK